MPLGNRLTIGFRVAEMEDKIGGGLIEEVIQVAEGEHKLVDTILESRSYVYYAALTGLCLYES